MSALANQSIEYNAETAKGDTQLLTFFLGEQEYGIEVTSVQGIKEWEPVTAVPFAPRYVLGVINLRGSIVPVFDLRVRFNMVKIAYDELTVIVIVKISTGAGYKVVGLVADAVSEVYSLHNDEMNTVPEFGHQEETECIKGLVSLGGNLVTVLNVEKIVLDGTGK